MPQIHGLSALQMGVPGHRPVHVLLRAIQQRRHQHADSRQSRGVGALARVHGEIRDDLVIARARGVQLPADRSGELGQASLDRHMDVLVVPLEWKTVLGELALDGVQALEQRVTVAFGNDSTRPEHARVRARLSDIVRPQPPVEADRRVHPLKVGVLGLAEAGHCP